MWLWEWIQLSSSLTRAVELLFDGIHKLSIEKKTIGRIVELFSIDDQWRVGWALAGTREGRTLRNFFSQVKTELVDSMVSLNVKEVIYMKRRTCLNHDIHRLIVSSSFGGDSCSSEV